jgi:AraC-like DNA-binding protein/ligand-binding sensor protein
MPAADPCKHRQFLVRQLKRSHIYRDYERAFRETTGLPLALRAVGNFSPPHLSDPNENPFCAAVASDAHACLGCRQAQRELEERAKEVPASTTCFAGLCDSAVPVRVGETVIAFLQTGQVLLAPGPRTPPAVVLRLASENPQLDTELLTRKYRQTRVLSKRNHDAILRLLAIFAQHLAALSNQIAVEQADDESPAIARARAYIAGHYAENIRLHLVAREVNMSSFYFCKIFKRATGMNFTDYLARIRIENVKHLLLAPHKRISEAAYETGFRSLSQFNRVFQRIAGEAPSRYRRRMLRSL